VFLPLHDGVPLRYLKAPVMARAIIGACTMAYVVVGLGFLPIGEGWIVAGFGVVPAVLFGTEALPGGLPFVPEPLTLLTSLFLHGSLVHLVGNMLFVWVFGDNVEDAMGHGRFLAFYLVCGAAAGLAHAYSDPESTRPLIGASGAVAGVVAAYLLLYPRVKLWGLFLGGIPLRVPARWAIGLWLVLQLFAAVMNSDEGVAWYAHLGGFAAGLVLTPILRRRYDPVLARLEATRVQG
jgi:membrane associated rhomboid family serine protease